MKKKYDTFKHTSYQSYIFQVYLSIFKCVLFRVYTYLKINPVTYLSYMSRLLLKSVNYTKEKVEKLDEIIQIERTSIEYFAIKIPKVSKIGIIQYSL